MLSTSVRAGLLNHNNKYYSECVKLNKVHTIGVVKNKHTGNGPLEDLFYYMTEGITREWPDSKSIIVLGCGSEKVSIDTLTFYSDECNRSFNITRKCKTSTCIFDNYSCIIIEKLHD
jgi:hypothetical protein|tara:strand:+ start:57 stop:407 length:351 start_codon:yes stop_codon:yes gene_type:complete